MTGPTAPPSPSQTQTASGGLDARVVRRIGALDLDVDLSVAPGEVVAVLGPNGSGKTSLVRTLAGLDPIDDGRIAIADTVVDDPAADLWVPPAARRVGLVAQDHVLFPDRSVLDNVAFGLRFGAGRIRKAAARERAGEWLRRFDLAELADARPAALSGGQAQRVALVRAVVTEPAVLLLDEPLSALDARVRPAVRAELRRVLAEVGGARVLVTHDPVDAVTMADRLVVLEGGRVVQTGTPREVTAAPRSRFVADLVGLTLVDGTASGARTVALASGLELTVADPVQGTDVGVVIRPASVALHANRPEGSARNAWSGEVVELSAGPDRVRVSLGGPVPVVAEVTPDAVDALGLAPGVVVWASVKAVDLVHFVR